MRSFIKRLMPKQVLVLLRQIRYVWIVAFFYLCRLFPIHKRRVVLCNVWGFGDNAKYVTEELARRLAKQQAGRAARQQAFELVFITNHPGAARAPEGVKVLKTNSLAAIKALATARVWVDNNRKENYTRKRKGQYYIQTWHGGIALKKIEKDYEKLSPAYRENAKKDSGMADLFVSNSSFCTNMYKRSFWYHGEIAEWGSPRNDILLAPLPGQLSGIKKRLGVAEDTRICIYAPTYREDNNTKPYFKDHESLRRVLAKSFGGEWVIMVRLHPLVADQSDFMKYSDTVVNASHYRDIYELMAVGDILITDYSNIMFEFSFMKKPVFLYAADEEEYTRERGFYFDYNSLPFPKAGSQEELCEKIAHYERETGQEKIQEFLDSLSIYEKGDASKKVADRILSTMGIKKGI